MDIWQMMSFGLKMLALIVMFSLLAIGAGIGIVKSRKKRAREKEQNGE